MATRHYSHPKYIKLFKNFFLLLAIAYPIYLLLTSTSNYAWIRIVEIFLALFLMIVLLVAAYFFQDIWVEDEGLQIEFLWKNYRVPWGDVIEIKTALGFWFAPEKNRASIVLVNGLTPFHRIFGLLYGLSIQPSFVIYPSVDKFQTLKDIIRKHIDNRGNVE